MECSGICLDSFLGLVASAELRGDSVVLELHDLHGKVVNLILRDCSSFPAGAELFALSLRPISG